MLLTYTAQMLRRLIGALLLCLSFQQQAFAGDGQTLQEIQSRMKTPATALEWIFEDTSRQNTFVKRIKDGGSGWLKLWPALRKEANDEQGKILDDSFGHLLTTRPKMALSEIRVGWPRTPEALEVTKRICALTGLELDEEVYLQLADEKTKTLASLKKRIASVGKINGGRVRKLKSACLETLKAQEKKWTKK